jgi:hypothetical protein
LAKHQLAQSLYHKWKRQLEVGVRVTCFFTNETEMG